MIDRFRASLPFTPTAAQDRAMAEIDGDLDRSVPMQRLLQGDVGWGRRWWPCTRCCEPSSATARER